MLWTLRMPVIGRAHVKEIRKSLLKRVAFRADDLVFERSGRASGHAALSVIPLLDGERSLGAVLILEDTTRVLQLAEERLRGSTERGRTKTRTGKAE